MNPFDRMYEGAPPWEIGRPQPEIVRLAEEGLVRGRVLDAGCGTGENALFLSARGHEVLGVDASSRAIASARAKGSRRGLGARFEVHDLLQPAELGYGFDTVVDSGLLHTFSDEARARYLAVLGSALRPGATLLLLCFSDAEPAWGGPRRLSRADLEASFTGRWHLDEVRPARYHHRRDEAGAQAHSAIATWIGAIRSRGN